jgi:glycosyltransferase involved in cell wall biosynthesis
MIKIVDVSNSPEKASARGVGGPIENDIMRYLKKYASFFNATFVTNPLDADVIITNDIFPSTVIDLPTPKVKRMDGVYSRTELLHRNLPLNASGQAADHVIFISEFSRQSLLKIYPEIKLKSNSVVLNRADFDEFHSVDFEEHYGVSIANDWSRPEKRLDAIIEIAKANPHEKIKLVGKPANVVYPPNIENVGYISDYKSMNKIVGGASYFVYLGFNDPAPKSVCQAMNAELPMFLTNSGGNVELAGDCAHYVYDFETYPMVHETVPPLNFDNVVSEFNVFSKSLYDYSLKLDAFNRVAAFEEMLHGYFDTLHRVVNCR